MTGHNHAPLVVFTSFAIAGAGLVASDAVLAGVARQSVYLPAIALGVGLEVIGILVSLLHLGRTSLAPLAGRRIGRSALSNEVAAAGLAVASGAALLATAAGGPPPAWLRAAAGLASAGLLVALGLVYRLRGQTTWTGPAVLTPLTAGCAFGAVFIQALAISGGMFRVTVFLLGADAAIFLLRWQETTPREDRIPVTFGEPAAWRWRHHWFAARLLLLNLVPIALLLKGPAPIAVAAAAAGLVVDRMAFYALAAQHTTEREIARIEEVIGSANPLQKS